MKSLLTVLALGLFTAATNAQSTTTKTAPKSTVKTAKQPVKTTAKKPVTAQVKKAPIETKVEGTRIKLTTDSGVIIIRLYDKTPLHRDNFVKLVKERFFDSLLFHRVISEFMIQGGDPQSKYAPAGTMLGNGDVGYTIPSEFNPELFHKKGALAAARTDNPQKLSSGCQFYIVQGRKYTDAELSNFEMMRQIKFSAKQREAYKTIGGTPMLDMNYTVYGEVESGLDVIDKIASVQKDMAYRPNGDVRMYAELIKQ